MNTQHTSLQNGVQLITTHLPDVQSFTLLVMVKAGSNNESIPGLAHFVEHILFKRTEKRASAFEINNEIEMVGGDINAATSQEFTEYYIKIPSEFYEKAFDILSDLLFHPAFTKDDIEKEKAVVIEEIHMYEDMPIRSVSDSFYSLIWKSHPLGRAIIGTPKTVRSIHADDLYNFLHTHYQASQLVLSVAGNLEGKDIHAMAEKYFSNIPTGSTSGNEFIEYDNQSIYNKGKQIRMYENEKFSLRIEERRTKQAHFCFGVEAIAYTHPSIHALEIAGGLLGEGSGSYLWQKVREELGASYYLNSEIDMFTHTGVWYFHAGVDNDKLSDVIRIIHMGITKLQNGDFSKEELTRAKEYLKGDFVMNLEGSEEIARFVASEYLEKGQIPSITEEKKALQDVSLDEVADIVQKLYQGRIYCNVLTKEIDIDIVKAIS